MVTPWEPGSFGVAFALAILSMFCWGTWSNTAKTSSAAKVPFAYFYMEYSFGVFLGAVIFFVSLGGSDMLTADAKAFDAADVPLDWKRCISSAAAGAIFNIANVLLVVGFTLAGLAVAFPVVVGTALVIGTLLTYVVQQQGEASLLFTGVGFALLAVLASSRSHAAIEHHKKQQSGTWERANAASEALLTEQQVGDAPSSHKGDMEQGGASSGAPELKTCGGSVLMVCVASGVLLGLWSPLSTYAMRDPEAGSPGQLNPYGDFLLYTAAVVVTSPVLLWMQQRDLMIPHDPTEVVPPSGLAHYLGMPPGSRGWGLLGGLVWAVGTMANLISGSKIGFALSYALGQSAPMVGVTWGLVYYREYDGAPVQAKYWLGAMFVLYAAAIACEAFGGS